MIRVFGLILLIFVHLKSFAQQDSPSTEQPSTGAEKGVQHTSKTEEEIFSSMFKEYNGRIRPCGEAKDVNASDSASKCGPTNVTVFVFLRSVDDINEKDMSYDLQMIFRQTWSDQRLAYKKFVPQNYDSPYLSISQDDSLHKPWMPDTYFINEKEGYRHEIDKGNIMMRITPEGEVTYSFRVTLTLACQMDFSAYPMDEHKCALDISSYGNTARYIVYKWRESSAVLMSTEFKNNVPSFEFEQVKRDSCEISTTTGVYSCLRLNIFFKRIFSYAQFVHLYLPGFVLVCTSWLSLWLSPQAIIARCAFVVSCFLTLLIQSAVISPTLPPTSTARSSDIWFTVCLCFLILNLIQLVILHRLNRLEQRQVEQSSIGGMVPHQMPQTYSAPAVKFVEEETLPKSTNIGGRMQAKRSVVTLMPKKSMMPKAEKKLSISHTEPTTPLMDDDKDKDLYLAGRKKTNVVVRKWRRCSRSQKFDVICRALFPLAFFFFNLVYWPALHM